MNFIAKSPQRWILSLYFLFLIFSKCHHLAINGAFVVLAPLSWLRRYSFWSRFGFPPSRLGIGWFALQIPSLLFSFFCTRKQHETAPESSTCYVPLKLPSIYSQLPLLCVPVTIRHGQKEQGKCDHVADKWSLQPLLSPSGVFCCLWTISSAWIYLCGASCLVIFSCF